MKHAAVIGWPVAHSRSPVIHQHWLKHYGIEGDYTKIAVPPQEIGIFLRSLGERALVGCNVTVPFKEAAFEAADIKLASASASGAANTLWLENGKLVCDNTDSYGFMTHLAQSAPSWAAASQPVLVLGAGGAARAIVWGLLQAGVTEIRIANRSTDRAEQVARSHRSGVQVVSWHQRSDALDGCSLIVNTTTLGLNGDGDPDINFARTSPSCIVADIVYVPLQTTFLRAAAAHGLQTVGGLGMLLHQAVPGFEKWFGVRPRVTPDLFDLVAAGIPPT